MTKIGPWQLTKYVIELYNLSDSYRKYHDEDEQLQHILKVIVDQEHNKLPACIRSYIRFELGESFFDELYAKVIHFYETHNNLQGNNILQFVQSKFNKRFKSWLKDMA